MPRYSYDPWKKKSKAGMKILDSMVKTSFKVGSVAIKSAKKAQQNRAKEAARQYQLQLRQQEFANVAQAVEDYNEYINVLKSVHKVTIEKINWTDIKNESMPIKPINENQRENEARRKSENFKPSFLDKILGITQRKVKKLDDEIILAIEVDKKEYEQALKEYQSNKNDWEILQEIASGILKKDPLAYNAGIQHFTPLIEISELGSRIAMRFDQSFATIDLHANNDSIIPKYILSQTSSGKLSKKNLPISKFNELYQDYICSCVLRIAREILCYLPVKFVIVNTLGELVNTTTGRIEEQTILSIAAHPETIAKLDFETIDPSDSMKNFKHNMKFTKTAGFKPVEKLNPQTLEQ